MAQSTPASPSPVVGVSGSIFELAFKKGAMMHHMHFSAPDLNTAVAKGREYCDKKSLRFIFVHEWLKNIDQMINFEPDENWHGTAFKPTS